MIDTLESELQQNLNKIDQMEFYMKTQIEKISIIWDSDWFLDV